MMVLLWYAELEDDPLEGWGEDSFEASNSDTSHDDAYNVNLAAPSSMAGKFKYGISDTDSGCDVPSRHRRPLGPIKFPASLLKPHSSRSEVIDHLRIESNRSASTVEQKHRIRKAIESLIFVRLRLRRWAKSIKENNNRSGRESQMINTYVPWAKSSGSDLDTISFPSQ